MHDWTRAAALSSSFPSEPFFFVLRDAGRKDLPALHVLIAVLGGRLDCQAAGRRPMLMAVWDFSLIFRFVTWGGWRRGFAVRAVDLR